MPIRRGTEHGSGFYQWGNRKKYYYIIGNKMSREDAYKKAKKQARAIYARGYKNR